MKFAWPLNELSETYQIAADILSYRLYICIKQLRWIDYRLGFKNACYFKQNYKTLYRVLGR